eukprot:1385173-Ditylum_brightwellii.AAC.1
MLYKPTNMLFTELNVDTINTVTTAKAQPKLESNQNNLPTVLITQQTTQAIATSPTSQPHLPPTNLTNPTIILPKPEHTSSADFFVAAFSAT